MATPSRIDDLLDDAQLAREDALGKTLDVQHALHNAMTALRAAWDGLLLVEGTVAGLGEREKPGAIFTTLSAIRECPAVRRNSWDGTTERRGDGLVAL